MERVQKILREWGIASRREGEKMILEGRVKVNGITVKLGDLASAQKDKIEVDGKLLTSQRKPSLIYLLLNKPKGYICTCDDPRQRKTVMDLLPAELRIGCGIHPVGRLDRNSSGALILTNDGALTVHLTHPRYNHPKTYSVTLRGKIPHRFIKKWAEGFMWEGKKTLPAEININYQDEQKTQMQITLREGRNRQIRKIAELFGYPVISLHRSAIAFLNVSSLSTGEYRYLTTKEVNYLKELHYQ
ncbi:pseudouridine synthase [Cyanobacterium aponinum]|nr:pseudouridine synthase [Cyanobacterium aponinum]MBD2393344.1 rRNA pseudouridine synthase [Cyanobacterium aponinum FACHB-4101]